MSTKSRANRDEVKSHRQDAPPAQRPWVCDGCERLLDVVERYVLPVTDPLSGSVLLEANCARCAFEKVTHADD